MFRKSLIIPPSTLLLAIACGGGNGNFQDKSGSNHFSFDDRHIEVESVYCSERMGRVTIRFDQGALYVSNREESPGYEAVLRFTSPERSEYVNRTIGDHPGEVLSTDGLHLDLDHGVRGEIRLMRSMVLLNPDRFPDATPKTMEIRATCPT